MADGSPATKRQHTRMMPSRSLKKGACAGFVARARAAHAFRSRPAKPACPLVNAASVGQPTRSPLRLLLADLLRVGAPQGTHAARAVAQHACSTREGGAARGRVKGGRQTTQAASRLAARQGNGAALAASAAYMHLSTGHCAVKGCGTYRCRPARSPGRASPPLRAPPCRPAASGLVSGAQSHLLRWLETCCNVPNASATETRLRPAPTGPPPRHGPT